MRGGRCLAIGKGEQVCGKIELSNEISNKPGKRYIKHTMNMITW